MTEAKAAGNERSKAEMPEARSPEDVFVTYFDFVWRSARRLGIREEDVDDAVQEVFVVVHRRFAEFQGRSSIETWLFGILVNVVQHYRRTRARHLNRVDALTAMGETDAQSSGGPHDSAAHREQVKILHALLDELDDEKRAVFVLAELEEKSVPEISEALGVNVNTVYSRLRAARQELERAVQRLNAREKGGVR
ncbi:RNA polymerase sigma factor [Labilithrix luteola]|uniref:RNA polymerase sigma factor n=1 Tax=Labilithrix luteola TaxID=1391654 RepID=UPI0011BAC383|nr:sigma-70 family RNA polymerase sigma factor [Labilithrix luteola]